MPARNKKRTKIARFRSKINRPESVFRVVAKDVPKKSKAKHRTKVHHKTNISLHSAIAVKTTVAVISIALLVMLTVVGFEGKQTLEAIDSANRSTVTNSFSEDTLKRLKLVGSVTQYPYEIGNFQSAPQDLQDFAIKDYRNLKSSCIVNGAFAGTVRYEIVNVVYDKYARITKECNGADTLLLVKISGVWTVVIKGNDEPSCKDVNAFGIPQGITYTCRDGYVIYTNPNP